MIFPIRCFTCGKCIGNKGNEYFSRVSKGENENDVLNSLNIKRMCCRRMFLTHVNIIDNLLLYK